MAFDKRGVVLKKRGMPLVPWSERTLEVSGATLCYEYPTHDMRRTYTLGSSWRCVAGSGDTFRLLAVDSQGLREEMTLRPLSKSKAERDTWVRVISSGIRIAVEESMRRRAAAAAQDRLADDGAWPDAMSPASPRVPRPQFQAMSTPRVGERSGGGEHICTAITGAVPAALAAAAVDSDAAGAAAVQLRSLREKLAGAQHTGAEAQQRVDELLLELAQQEGKHEQLKAESALASTTFADAAAEHGEWKRRCEVAEAACTDLEANMASLRAEHAASAAAAGRAAALDVEQGCAERAALAAERAALAVELAQLREAKAVSEKELRVLSAQSNTSAVTAAAVSEVREEQARESRAAAAASQRLRADLEAALVKVENLCCEHAAAEQKLQVRITALKAQNETALATAAAVVTTAASKSEATATAAAAVSASRIAELEAKAVALEAKLVEAVRAKQEDHAPEQTPACADSAPEDDLPEDEANLRRRLRGATALLDAAVVSTARALEQSRVARRFQRQTLVDAKSQMAVPAQCLSATPRGAACPMPTGVYKTPAGWQVRAAGIVEVLGSFTSEQAAVRAYDEAYARVVTQSGLRDQREAQGRLVRLQLPPLTGGLGMDLASTTKPPFYVWVKSIARGSMVARRVQVGDLLVAINGECCQGQQITKVVSTLQGGLRALDMTFVRSAAACQPAEDKRGQLPWMQNLTNIRRNLTSKERTHTRTTRLLQQIELETKAVSAMSQQLKKRGHRAVAAAPSSAKKQQRRPIRL